MSIKDFGHMAYLSHGIKIALTPYFNLKEVSTICLYNMFHYISIKASFINMILPT